MSKIAAPLNFAALFGRTPRTYLRPALNIIVQERLLEVLIILHLSRFLVLVYNVRVQFTIMLLCSYEFLYRVSCITTATSPRRQSVLHSTSCLKKTAQNNFCQNFVKFPTAKIFGIKMANSRKQAKIMWDAFIFTVRRYALHGLCDRNSVCLSVRLTVCHTRALCPHGSTYDHDFFTISTPSF